MKLLPSIALTAFFLFTNPLAIAGSHGIAMHGDLKYPESFSHFNYTNPDAVKGGDVRLSAIGTFDSFNPFIIKGTVADDISQIYDSLLTRAEDEPFSLYGLIAQSIEMAEDRSWIKFSLNPSAKFSDGEALTAEDVIYTFKLLREQGSPFYKAYYGDIIEISSTSPHSVLFTFKAGNRELPLIVGEVPILPKHYWQERNFQAVNLDIPVGSGPYIIRSFDAGRSVTFQRNPDYWAKDLPVNRGRFNFDQIKYDYYRDTTVALEAFKAGEYDFRQENSSKQWATGYQGDNFDQGKIIRKNLEHTNPTGMQAFVMNTRREMFSDKRVRQALEQLFDFEWTNKNIFYDAYTRTQSFFSNSEMAATQLPDAKELALLNELQAPLPKELFTQVFQPTKTDGSGNIRQQMRSALRLLVSAGWELKGGKLLSADGKPFEFEILLVQPSLERVVAPFLKNLARVGIEAKIRLVDPSQYINRVREFDFDMIVGSFPQSSSPGNEQRDFWHSEMASQPGTRNIIGIQDSAVDQLIDKIIQADNREALVRACRALDRVLQWNYYVIPQFHISSYRVAYWNKFGIPDTRPSYALGFDSWWVLPDSQTKAE